MIRFGLCCVFRTQPIKFRRTTATALQAMGQKSRLDRLSDLCRHNAGALMDALRFCHENGIGCFRVNSQVLPLKTHPAVGYALTDLPDHVEITQTFLECGRFAAQNDIRTTFQPDQFVLLSSPKSPVTQSAMAELAYQAEVAEWIHADVITIHGGGRTETKCKPLTGSSAASSDCPSPSGPG